MQAGCANSIIGKNDFGNFCFVVLSDVRIERHDPMHAIVRERASSPVS